MEKGTYYKLLITDCIARYFCILKKYIYESVTVVLRSNNNENLTKIFSHHVCDEVYKHNLSSRFGLLIEWWWLLPTLVHVRGGEGMDEFEEQGNADYGGMV